MSTILDALKKSERERTIARGIGFGDASRYWAPRADHSWRWIAVAVAFAVVLVAIALLWWRHEPVAVTAVATSETPSARVPTPVPALPDAAPPADLRSLPAQTGDVKLLSALPTSFQQSLGPMTVTIHVYSPNETERLLYINNRQYQRGDEVANGVVVEDIVPDGVVLRLRDQRFKLPRPS